MNQDDIAGGIYSTHQKAEDAIKSLQHDGFDMRKLSIIGKDYRSEENVVVLTRRSPAPVICCVRAVSSSSSTG